MGSQNPAQGRIRSDDWRAAVVHEKVFGCFIFCGSFMLL